MCISHFILMSFSKCMVLLVGLICIQEGLSYIQPFGTSVEVFGQIKARGSGLLVCFAMGSTVIQATASEAWWRTDSTATHFPAAFSFCGTSVCT